MTDRKPRGATLSEEGLSELLKKQVQKRKELEIINNIILNQPKPRRFSAKEKAKPKEKPKAKPIVPKIRKPRGATLNGISERDRISAIIKKGYPNLTSNSTTNW